MEPRFTLVDWLILADVGIAVAIVLWVRWKGRAARESSGAPRMPFHLWLPWLLAETVLVLVWLASAFLHGRFAALLLWLAAVGSVMRRWRERARRLKANGRPPVAERARTLLVGGSRPLAGSHAVILLGLAIGIAIVAVPFALAGDPIGFAFGLLAILLFVRLLRESTRA
jgi:hypothetical protein